MHFVWDVVFVSCQQCFSHSLDYVSVQRGDIRESPVRRSSCVDDQWFKSRICVANVLLSTSFMKGLIIIFRITALSWSFQLEKSLFRFNFYTFFQIHRLKFVHIHSRLCLHYHPYYPTYGDDRNIGVFERPSLSHFPTNYTSSEFSELFEIIFCW